MSRFVLGSNLNIAGDLDSVLNTDYSGGLNTPGNLDDIIECLILIGSLFSLFIFKILSKNISLLILATLCQIFVLI